MEIPTYGDTRVRDAALPGARLNAEAPIEAFGGGAAAAGVTRAAQGVAGEVLDIASKERTKAVDTMTQEAFAKLVSEKNRLLHSQNGALTKKGKDAFATPEVYGKEFDDAAGKIEKELADPEARRMFQGMRLRERGELDSVLSRHVAQQSEYLKDETFKGLVSTLTDDAIANMTMPGKIKGNLKLLQSAAMGYAADKGLSGEDAKPARDAMWKNITSKLHTGVIDRLVAQESYDAARAYFDANKAGIAGLDMDGLERQIKKTDVLAQKDSYLTAAGLLDKSKGADPAKVVPGFNQLSGEQRAALERRFKNAQSPTAHHEFYSLTQAQVADLDRAEFEVKYWSRFDGEHRRKAEAYWQAAVAANEGGSKAEAFKSMRGDRDMVVSALRKNKLVAASGDLKDADFELSQRFEDYVDDKFKVFAHENKRNPKDEEKQAIIHRAMLDKVYVDDGYFSDSLKPRGVLTDDEIKKAYVPIASIRRTDRLMLVNLARAQGIIKGAEAGGPSDDRAVVMLKSKIERAYAAAASGTADRAALIAIMKGDQ